MSETKVTSKGIEGQPSRRLLHFFWIIDCSGSMMGTKIESVNYAIRNVIPEIRKIQNGERVKVYMYVIRFGSEAIWHIGPDGLTIEDFEKNWKDLDADLGATNIPDAINLLIEALDTEKLGRRNVPPVCILLSDGHCTESGYEEAIEQLDKLPWGKKAVRLSIGIQTEQDSYNKEELDMFISPYLRKEGNIETLHADNPQKLVRYIRTTSTVASTSVSKSRAVDADQENSIQPVYIDRETLESDDDFADLDAGDVF